jgi:hypothetical protein
MPAHGRSLIDYKEAERLYVLEGKSLRQIARDLGLRSNASISAIARREDWAGRRSAYLASIARRSYETAAATVANEQNEIRNEAVLAGRATVRKYIEGLADGSIKPNAKDAQVWAQFLMDAMRETSGMSTDVPEVKVVSPPDTELLRRVVEAARERVAPSRGVGPDVLVQPANPRPD